MQARFVVLNSLGRFDGNWNEATEEEYGKMVDLMKKVMEFKYLSLDQRVQDLLYADQVAIIFPQDILRNSVLMVERKN